MSPTRWLLLPLLVWGTIAPSARAAPASGDRWRRPLAHRNQFPPALLFLSLEPERGDVLGKKEVLLSFDFSYSNILANHMLSSESLLIDMEYLRSLARIGLGLGRGFELDASLPVLTMYGGFLDGFVSGFHRVFGLPNNLRSKTPNGLFQYRYLVGDRILLERSKSGTTVGDVSFELKKTLLGGERERNELALRGAMKLPTGSLDRLTGSGATDFGLGIAASRVGSRFGGYFNLNYQFLGSTSDLTAKDFLSFMGAFDFRFKRSLAMIVQIDQFQPILESAIGVLDQPGRELVVGLRWRHSDRLEYEWRLAEDLSTTSPDFSLGFQVGWGWERP